MWKLGHLTTAAGEPDARIALHHPRRSGSGSCSRRSTTSRTAASSRSEAQQASGLINLSRQLGGSFGIAILNTYVTTHTQFHRVDLLTNVYAGNPGVVERLQALAGGLMAHGYTALDAQRGALGVLDATVMRQASMLSYNDAWMMILLSFVIASPAILLLGRPGKRPAAAAEMH